MMTICKDLGLRILFQNAKYHLAASSSKRKQNKRRFWTAFFYFWTGSSQMRCPTREKHRVPKRWPWRCILTAQFVSNSKTVHKHVHMCMQVPAQFAPNRRAFKATQENKQWVFRVQTQSIEELWSKQTTLVRQSRTRAISSSPDAEQTQTSRARYPEDDTISKRRPSKCHTLEIKALAPGAERYCRLADDCHHKAFSRHGHYVMKLQPCRNRLLFTVTGATPPLLNR